MSDEDIITSLPVVPVKRTVLFPETLVPFTIGRARSIAAVEAAMNSEDKAIVFSAQRHFEQEDPKFEDLYQIGTKALIKQMVKTGEGHLNILVQGLERVVLLKMEKNDPYLTARARQLDLPTDSSPEIEALHRALLDLVSQLSRNASARSRPILSDELSLELGEALLLVLELDVGLRQILEAPLEGCTHGAKRLAESVDLIHS